MYRSYLRYLEADDECLVDYGYRLPGLRHISGIYLPGEALRTIYVANPAPVIPVIPGIGAPASPGGEQNR
jgi:hypothetical protein